MTNPGAPPSNTGHGSSEHSAQPPAAAPGRAKQALALQIEPTAANAVTDAARLGATEPSSRASLHPVRVLAGAVTALLLLAAVVTAGVLYGFPWYVRARCIEAAAAHGIALSIEDAKVASGGVRLLRVRVTSDEIPEVRAQAPELDVELSGLLPNKMIVHGAELTLTGPWSRLQSDLVKWRASPNGGQAGAWPPVLLDVDRARIAWSAPLGDNARIDAALVHAELRWNDRDLEVHARADPVNVRWPDGMFGPWRFDVDRTAGSSRLRIALDPGVPDACTVLIVGDEERTTSVDVVIPRSPLERLGIPPQFIGLNAAGAQLEATVHYAAVGPAHADASAKGALYGLALRPLPLGVDIAWEGAAGGDPNAGVDIKKARLSVGPLVGALTGTFKRFEEGFRVDFAWGAGPVACAALGPLLRGDMRAAAMASFDSRDLGATKIEFRPEVSCHVL